jgi:glycosyltransferase involved in cell wall biosynthesis
MLGWEFPPFISGGLGTACYGLTKAMSAQGTDVLFVLPRPVSTPFSTHVQLISPQPGSPLAGATAEFRLDEFENVTFRTIDAHLANPYGTAQTYKQTVREVEKVKVPARVEPAAQQVQVSVPAPAAVAEPPRVPDATHYAGNLFAEVQRYATLAGEVARNELIDVVHAHDWMTFPAGIEVARTRSVPLVVHVHSTEFDRSGSNVDQRIYDIERRGMHAAIKVIAVSHLTKSTICERYGIDPAKVDVVYNAIDSNGNGGGTANKFDAEKYKIHNNEKIVLFLGRMTMQKGPEYFLAAAKKVLEVMENVKFVMAGSGDLMRKTIEMANAMGIGHKVLFTGFLKQADVDKVFKLADLYVMPSVSEPFGIAPLEALNNEVPVIISKQSGVSEVLNHVLKVDFWDVNEMANKIVAVLKHPPLASMLRQHGSFEVKKLSWADAAKRCVEIYDIAIDTMRDAVVAPA